MPRTHTYQGNPGHVGRFGYLNVGDHVDLHLDEELSVLENPDFAPLSDQKLPEKIVPLKARFIYDLRHIDWSHKQAASHLRALSHHTLLNILVAMNELGIEVDAFESMPTDDVVDNIRRAARAHGWDTLTHAERLACPAASNEDEGSDADEGQGTEDDDDNEDESADTNSDEAPDGASKEEEDGDTSAHSDEEKEEAPPAPAGPARKRPAAKKAAKPSKP